MATTEEHRKNTRVHFEALIDLTCGGKSFTGCETDNLSTKGVFVLGAKDLQIDDQCNLTLHLSGGQNIVLSMKGRVQRITDTGVGIHFTETDLDSFTHLKNIIYYNSENPDTITDIY